MFDTVNFWLDRVELSGGSPFDTQHYLSELTERQNEKSGYSCSGKVLDYTVYVNENGLYLTGSLCKSFFNDNLQTLTRRATQQAIEQLSDNLHLDISKAKVTRLDISTVIPTKRPPADYYNFLGQKPYFERMQYNSDTLYYQNSKTQPTKQIIFYDKTKEAKNSGAAIPELWQNANLFRYELRFKKRLNRQLKADVTASTLTNSVFYTNIIQSWYSEFKTIQKLKNQNFMIDDITTLKVAKEALFAHLLQQSGQNIIDEFLNELKAQKKFNSRSDYTKLKTDLNKMLVAKNGNKSDLIKELETAIFNIAKNAH